MVGRLLCRGRSNVGKPLMAAETIPVIVRVFSRPHDCYRVICSSTNSLKDLKDKLASEFGLANIVFCLRGAALSLDSELISNLAARHRRPLILVAAPAVEEVSRVYIIIFVFIRICLQSFCDTQVYSSLPFRPASASTTATPLSRRSLRSTPLSSVSFPTLSPTYSRYLASFDFFFVSRRSQSLGWCHQRPSIQCSASHVC
jgi:hypothetical protein